MYGLTTTNIKGTEMLHFGGIRKESRTGCKKKSVLRKQVMRKQENRDVHTCFNMTNIKPTANMTEKND